jgi:hypothetical protein
VAQSKVSLNGGFRADVPNTRSMTASSFPASFEFNKKHAVTEEEMMPDQRLKDLCVLAVDDDADTRVLAAMYLSDFSSLRTNSFSMNANQQPKEDLAELGSEKQPWNEAWELAWEGYQAQEKRGGDEKLASLRNRAKQENDARYLGPIYLKVFQYLPKAERPKAP